MNLNKIIILSKPLQALVLSHLLCEAVNHIHIFSTRVHGPFSSRETFYGEISPHIPQQEAVIPPLPAPSNNKTSTTHCTKYLF